MMRPSDLKRIREQLGLTQQQLADALHTTRVSVARYEAGMRRIPGVMKVAMERLSRLSHRIVWVNPHRGAGGDFVPSTLGMMVAAPFADVIASGNDLASLEKLAGLLPELR